MVFQEAQRIDLARVLWMRLESKMGLIIHAVTEEP
jgi:hypothetical protein